MYISSSGAVNTATASLTTFVDGTQAYGEWLQLNMNAAVLVSGYQFLGGSSIATWIIAGSNDRQSWMVLGTGSNTGINQAFTGLLSTPTQASSVRIIMTKMYNGYTVGYL